MSMRHWFQTIPTPTRLLWLYAIAFGIATALGPDGEGMPKRAELVSGVALQVIVSLWVLADARRRGRPLPYDFGSFVYFAWPFILPVYLFQTRGARALLALLGFAGICFLALFTAGAAAFVRAYLED